MTYAAGHLKHNPDTLEVAIRTVFPEETLPDSAWIVATTNKGTYMAPTVKVADWADLYTPPLPADPDA